MLLTAILLATALPPNFPPSIDLNPSPSLASSYPGGAVIIASFSPGSLIRISPLSPSLPNAHSPRPQLVFPTALALATSLTLRVSPITMAASSVMSLYVVSFERSSLWREPFKHSPAIHSNPFGCSRRVSSRWALLNFVNHVLFPSIAMALSRIQRDQTTFTVLAVNLLYLTAVQSLTEATLHRRAGRHIDSMRSTKLITSLASVLSFALLRITTLSRFCGAPIPTLSPTSIFTHLWTLSEATYLLCGASKPIAAAYIHGQFIGSEYEECVVRE